MRGRRQIWLERQSWMRLVEFTVVRRATLRTARHPRRPSVLAWWLDWFYGWRVGTRDAMFPLGQPRSWRYSDLVIAPEHLESVRRWKPRIEYREERQRRLDRDHRVVGHHVLGADRLVAHLAHDAAERALGERVEGQLDPQAAQIFDGLVHDYRMGEAIAKPGFLGARRAPLGRPLPHFSFADARVPWLAGILGAEVAVMHLDLRRRIAALQVAAAHPAGATLRRAARGHGAFEWWLPAGHDIHVFDTTRWQRAAVHTLPGPVRHLHAVDDAEDGAVWALVDQRGDAALWVLDGAASGMWRPVSGGLVSALAPSPTPRGLPLLVLRRGPSALLQLDHRGGVRDQWPLPAGIEDGIAWAGTD